MVYRLSAMVRYDVKPPKAAYIKAVAVPRVRAVLTGLFRGNLGVELRRLQKVRLGAMAVGLVWHRGGKGRISRLFDASCSNRLYKSRRRSVSNNVLKPSVIVIRDGLVHIDIRDSLGRVLIPERILTNPLIFSDSDLTQI